MSLCALMCCSLNAAIISSVNSIYLGESIYIMEGLLRRVSLDGGQLCLTTTCMTVKRGTREGITHQLWFYMQLLDRPSVVYQKRGSAWLTFTERGSFLYAVQSLNNEYEPGLWRCSPWCPVNKCRDPTMLSSFVGFTAGRRLLKENEIFLWDKGHMELT